MPNSDLKLINILLSREKDTARDRRSDHGQGAPNIFTACIWCYHNQSKNRWGGGGNPV